MKEFCNSVLGDYNLTWATNDPDFTPCFQYTVLVWVPCIFLIVFTPLELHYIKTSKYSNIPWSFLNISRLALSLMLIGISLCDFIVSLVLRESADLYDVHVVTPTIKIITFIISTTLSLMAKKHGIMSSGIQFLFWFLLCMGAIPQFRSEIRLYRATENETIWPDYKFSSYMIYFPLTVFQFIVHCFADQFPLSSDYHPLSIPKTNPSPELKASFLQKILFFWFEPVTWKGYRKPLTADDLYDLNPKDTSYELVPPFDKYWQQSIEKGTKSNVKRGTEKNKDSGGGIGPNPRRTNGSILPAMLKAFGGPILFTAFLKLIIDLLNFVPPFLLKFLIDFAMDLDAPLWHGMVYLVAFCTVSVLTSILMGQYFVTGSLVGFRIRSALICAIYRKALTISSTAKKDTTVGEIVNLMAVDAQRFIEMMMYIHNIWAGPMTITLAIYFLWGLIGAAVVPGLIFLILMLPLNAYLATCMRKYQQQQMKKKDERVKLMNEILNGMKVLKLYAWEPSFEGYIQDVRKDELKLIKYMAYLNAITYITWTLTPFLVTLLSFATYVLLDEKNIIDATTAFVSLTLFNIVRMPLISTPITIATLLQSWVAIGRINNYMNSEDLVDDNITHNKDDCPIRIKDGTFSWGDEICLRNINLIIGRGTLTAIVGTVGSGKSSLISSILGETEKLNGSVNVYGSFAYVAQQAWIQNATLQQNVLFGKPLNKKFYDQVIDACALTPDLELLAAGDQTEIGEKGINLSGGQKQRVALARAVYSQADIYLLDDPLSAVDSHVGKHIFERVIGPNGILAGKTRVLVTHGITYLPDVLTIHVMTGGEITESGSYSNLIKEKGAFAAFIEQHLNEIDLQEAGLEDIQNALKDNEKIAQILQRAISTISVNSSKRNSISSDSKTVSRQNSQIKAITSEQATLIQEEISETGRVDIHIYLRYFKSVGYFVMSLAVLSCMIFQGFSVYSNAWLSQWSLDNSSSIPEVRDKYIGVYGGLGVVQAIFLCVTAFSLGLGGVWAAKDIHTNLLKQTMRLPMSFFDTTPIGRIVNRFSKDVDVVDNMIPLMLRFGILMFFSVISVFIVISISTPIFMTVIIPLGIVYCFIHVFFIATSRQLKRIESVTRSPVYSHFGETITGQSTIRAYQAQDRFIAESNMRIDYNQKCTYPSLIISDRWLSVRLELIGTIVIFFAVLFAVLAKGTIDSATVGLSISYALQVTQLLSFMVMTAALVESNIVAHERLESYNREPKEAEWILKPVDPEWPSQGEVKFKNYQLRYRENLDLVLKGITFTVEPGQKIGIVGRTGAGKSSLTLALFRIIEAAGGSILIDGINIAELGLHSLRSRLTIIPQDPVLFSGTLRMNIDPLKAHTDDDVWRALELSHLKAFVKGTQNGLNHAVSEGGENLSVGQRQLICLARALLRKTKILILDEATAAVDLETDALIQKTIRSQFNECTILTIAHRLNTIMDSDKVLVLYQGCVAEYDSPSSLLENKNSIFHSMAKNAGII